MNKCLAHGVYFTVAAIYRDGAYPPFNPQLKYEAPEEEPAVDQALIVRFAGRLHNVFAPSQQRVKKEIVESFISTKKMAENNEMAPMIRNAVSILESRRG